MAMDNKQKTMLGVLAVLVLGMGGYWFTMLRGDTNTATAVSRGPAVKRQRATRVEKKKPKAKRRERSKTKATAQRREREAVDTKKTGPSKRRKKRGPKEKKKKVMPAA